MQTVNCQIIKCQSTIAIALESNIVTDLRNHKSAIHLQSLKRTKLYTEQNVGAFGKETRGDRSVFRYIGRRLWRCGFHWSPLLHGLEAVLRQHPILWRKI